MVGVAAGLASGGLLPFVCGASCFLTGRALEQIKADIAYSNANVKRVGISSGMTYGELGPTHHSIEDFAWMRVLPNLPVIAPCDAVETSAATAWPSWSTPPIAQAQQALLARLVLLENRLKAVTNSAKNPLQAMFAEDDAPINSYDDEVQRHLDRLKTTRDLIRKGEPGTSGSAALSERKRPTPFSTSGRWP